MAPVRFARWLLNSTPALRWHRRRLRLGAQWLPYHPAELRRLHLWHPERHWVKRLAEVRRSCYIVHSDKELTLSQQRRHPTRERVACAS